jgi:hypothetical protein
MTDSISICHVRIPSEIFEIGDVNEKQSRIHGTTTVVAVPMFCGGRMIESIHVKQPMTQEKKMK